jgi:hypothetical protein
MQPRDYWILVLNSLIYLIAQLNVELQPFIAEALTLLAHIIHRTSAWNCIVNHAAIRGSTVRTRPLYSSFSPLTVSLL